MALKPPTDTELRARYRALIAAGARPEELWLAAERKKSWAARESIEQRHRRHEVERALAEVVNAVAKIAEGTHERNKNAAANVG